VVAVDRRAVDTDMAHMAFDATVLLEQLPAERQIGTADTASRSMI
jgi:hypothetical protein